MLPIEKETLKNTQINFTVITKLRLKSCERIYTIGFSLFLKDQSSQYISLRVPNSKLVENILHTFVWHKNGMTS